MTRRSTTFWAALCASVLLAAPAFAQDAPADDPAGDRGPDDPRVELPADADPGARPDAELDEDAVRERVVFLLSGYEYFPDRDALDEVAGPEVMAPLLRALADQPDRRPSVRVRAVDALGYYDDEATRSYLQGLAVTDTARTPKEQLRVARSMRHHAIMSYAKVTGPEGLEVLGTLLEDPDLQIRLSAASAIGKHGGEAGEVRLAKELEAATNPVMKRELRKHVR